MSSVSDLLRSHLEDKSAPLWWPGLAEIVAIYAESLSTTHVMTGGLECPRWERVVRSSRRPEMWTTVEVLPSPLEQQFEVPGTRFLSAEDVSQARVMSALIAALDEIAVVPQLGEMVGHLVRRVHLLQPENPDYDINFSYPTLPFSVFVSVPAEPSQGVRWRLAEALVHEAGHLQLSLLERVVPLVTECSTTFYAPWRREQRPLRGVLHGLYVFGLIAEWMRSSGAPADAVRKRIAEIRDDASQLCNFPEAKGLTADGVAVAHTILAHLICRS